MPSQAPFPNWSGYSSRTFDDFVEQEQSLAGFRQQYRQLSPGRFRGRIRSLALDGLTLSRESLNCGMENEFRLDAAQTCLAFAASPATRGAGSFGDIDRLRGAMPAGGRDHRIFLDPGADLLILTLPADETAEDPPGCDLQDPSLVTWLCALLDAVEAGAADAALARLLPDLIRDRVTLSARPAPVARGGQGRHRALLDEIVAACRVLMPEDQTVSGLSRHLGRARADLRAACLAVTGVPLDRLLAARRLSDTYRTLRTDPSRRKVGEIAIDHGYTHGGRFSAEFKAMFDTLPGAVRRRG